MKTRFYYLNEINLNNRMKTNDKKKTNGKC